MEQLKMILESADTALLVQILKAVRAGETIDLDEIISGILTQRQSAEMEGPRDKRASWGA